MEFLSSFLQDEFLHMEVGLLGIMQVAALFVIEYFFKKEAKQREKIQTMHEHCQKKTEERAATRAEESLLAMRMVSDSIALGIVNAITLKEGKSNGEVERAIEDAKDSLKRYHEFNQKLATKRLDE